jgi:signal transduction histidine kinase
VTTRRAVFRRFDAPVDYGALRPWLQRARAVLGLVLVAGCVVAIIGGLPSAWWPLLVASLVVVDATVRSVRACGALGSLVVDAIAIAAALGGVGGAGIALVAGAAYLIAASVAFAGTRGLVVAIPAFLGALGLRLLVGLPHVSTVPPQSAFALWTAVTVFLAAVALSLMATTGAVHEARAAQHSAFETERRASAMRNEFVSMVTHELRTPLTNIAGFALTIHDNWRDLDAAEVEEFLRIIVGEAEHLGNLVEDVLAIPRLEAGRLLMDVTDFPLRPAAYKIADLIFPAGGSKSASVAIGGNVHVAADPNRVEQILRNLLENARKYGGDQVTIEATRDGDSYRVVIADNGTGVPAEHAERIFQPFEQASAGDARAESGFGLGLAVAKHLVEAMGGRIWYEPGFPVGARFCFTLPAATAPAVTSAVA